MGCTTACGDHGSFPGYYEFLNPTTDRRDAMAEFLWLPLGSTATYNEEELVRMGIAGLYRPNGPT
jgi:hypothetical protein